VTVEVEMPLDALAGDTDVVTITATSQEIHRLTTDPYNNDCQPGLRCQSHPKPQRCLALR
jgi:hypothetical protein